MSHYIPIMKVMDVFFIRVEKNKLIFTCSMSPFTGAYYVRIQILQAFLFYRSAALDITRLNVYRQVHNLHFFLKKVWMAF